MDITLKTFTRAPRVFLMLLMFSLLLACQTMQSKTACALPSGFNVDKAFTQANMDLTNVRCQYNFDQYLERLLEITASDPKEENKKHFTDFLAKARDNGVLSQVQAQQYYRRYFTADFVSLGTMHNNCSTTCRDQEETIKKLRNELRDKRRGLLTVVKDNATYAQADREFNNLLTLIDGTCLACQEAE